MISSKTYLHSAELAVENYLSTLRALFKSIDQIEYILRQSKIHFSEKEYNDILKRIACDMAYDDEMLDDINESIKEILTQRKKLDNP